MDQTPHPAREWLPIATAPSDRALEVCVIDKSGAHALVFPCRKNGADWVNATTNKWIDIQPTHWRLWVGDD
jgi:hypothetical protein